MFIVFLLFYHYTYNVFILYLFVLGNRTLTNIDHVIYMESNVMNPHQKRGFHLRKLEHVKNLGGYNRKASMLSHSYRDREIASKIIWTLTPTGSISILSTQCEILVPFKSLLNFIVYQRLT